MSAAEAELRLASHGDPNHAEVGSMLRALAPIVSQLALDVAGDFCPNRMGKLMTALSFMAGQQLGILITIGVARDQDKRRITDSMAKNFRSGIDLGKRATTRAVIDDVAGHA